MKSTDDFYDKMVDGICEQINILRDYVSATEDDKYMPDALIDHLTKIRDELERTKAHNIDGMLRELWDDYERF